MDCDIAAAAASDDLSQTIDYAELSRRVTAHCIAKPVEMLDTLLEHLAELILSEFASTQVSF
ncbi:dihydroneopterin aldolase, partial [Pseudoalteromonas ruthenica]|uniref:dihydroneopterin aldolase n=1 Tax=Pseudoalteromonas ruthenica TaxID=151081 RepID=UPI003D268AC1